MNRKIISIITLSSLILSTFSGCKAIQDNLNLAKGNNKAEEISIPAYYSVTNAFADHEETPFYELDVRIPKITYSNEESDSLIDPINEEIYKNITSHVEDAKKNAYATYEKYIESAEANLMSDREKKIDALKNKYKSVIGSDEVKAIARILNKKVEIVDVASDSEVEGFTNSEELIIPGLHNKNIIVVETTAKSDSIKETSMSIEGRPGKKKMLAPEEKEVVKSTPSNINSDFGGHDDFDIEPKEIFGTGHDDFDEMPSDIFGTGHDDFDEMPSDIFGTGHDDFDEMPKGKFRNASPSYIKELPRFNGKPFIGGMRKFNRASLSDIDFDEISVENFYRELRLIEFSSIPSRRELTRQFNRTFIDCSWDVKCLDGEYLSLLIDISESRAQASSKRYYYNIDLKNKKLVKLSDILGENFKETCVNSINKEIETWNDEKKSALKSNYNLDSFINDNTSFFINNNHTPVVVLDKYMITAGAVGYPEFQISK